MYLLTSNFISNFITSECGLYCWISNFNGASRMLGLALVWLILELMTRVVAHKNVTSKADPQLAKSRDQGSWWLVAFASGLILCLILTILYFDWKPDLPNSLFWVGIVLMGLGAALRMWAVIALDQFFTMEVMIFPNHQIVKKGPYRLLRHPSYAGVFIVTLGFGLASGYLLVLLSVFIILACTLGYRIYVEEKALKEKFGDEWVAYAEKTWKILPGIF